jgi:membrane protein required for colicin V production
MSTGLGAFSLLDWVLLLVLLFSSVRAAMRGLVLELFWLVGSVVGLFVACELYDIPAPLLQSITHSLALAHALSFLLIVFGVMLLAGFIGRMLSRSVRFVGLGWLDSVAGGLFGLLRGVLIISAGIMAIAAFLPANLPLDKEFSGSTLAPYFLQAAHGVSSFVPVEMEQRVNSGMNLINRHWPQQQP